MEEKITPSFSSTGLLIKKCYCRRCMKDKLGNQFYIATNIKLDSNGIMSICRSCINEIYEDYMSKTGDVCRSIYLTCKDIDMRYEKSVVQKLEDGLATGKKVNRKIKILNDRITFSNYRAVLYEDLLGKDLMFVEPNSVTDVILNETKKVDEFREVVAFWGSGFTQDQYSYLQREFDDWKENSDIACNTKQEILLIKELCFKALEMEENRKSGKSTSSMLKEIQEIMKTAGVDPAKQADLRAKKENNSSLRSGVLSPIIKAIECYEPSEYYEDKELFVNYDSYLPKYCHNFLRKPIINFLNETPDFALDNYDNDEEDEEFEHGEREQDS